MVLGEAVEFGDVEAGGDCMDVHYAHFFEEMYGESLHHVGCMMEGAGRGNAVLVEPGFGFLDDSA